MNSNLINSYIAHISVISKGIVACFFLLLLSSPLRAQRSADDVLAMQYYQNGDYEKAAVIYEKLYNKTNNPQAYYDQYLNVLIKLKRYADAEKAAKKMMKAFPDNYNFQIDFGRILQEQGQQERATEWYNNIIKNMPKNEFAIRDIASAFYRTNTMEFSVKTLLTGRSLLKDESAFAFDLISLYRYQKNKTMLVQEYLNLISQPEYEAQIVNQAKIAFSSIFDSPEDYVVLKSSLLKRIQKDPQNTSLTELLAWSYLQQKEYNLALKQVIALDRRLKEDGSRVYDFVMLLIANRAYDIAVEGLEYILTKGSNGEYYIPAKIQILNSKNQLLTSGNVKREELLGLEKEYLSMLQEFGRSYTTVFAIRQLANLQAFYLNKLKDAEALLEEAVKIPKLPYSVVGQIKLELGDIYILTGELWEAALIYGQVEKDYSNEPTGQEAKFRGAKLSYYQGEFAWAKAQLDVLKSSTTQLIANDALNLSLLIQENTATLADTNALKKYAQADLYILKNDPSKALNTLDSINKLFPQNSLEDDILMSKAKIYLKEGNTQQALIELQLIIDKYSYDIWADDALFTLGDIYETKLNDPEKAKIYFQKIITDYPGSLLVTEARKRFRNLRGDNIG